MKGIILFVCAVSCACAFTTNEDALSSSCNKLQCAAKGGKCGFEPSSNVLSICTPGLQYCNSGACSDFIKESMPCVKDGPEGQCGGLECQESREGSYMCLPVVLRNNPGEDCTTDAHCYFKTAYATNSTCVQGKCYGKHADASCYSEDQCVVGLYCDEASSTCALLGNDGAACSARHQCASGNCVPVSSNSTTRTCMSSHTVSEGGACETTDDCVDGLYCSPTTAGHIWGTCHQSHSSSYNVCYLDSDCSSSESCTCVGGSGKRLCMAPPTRPAKLAMLEVNKTTCSEKHNCSDYSCILDNCAYELCEYNSNMFGPAVWNENMRYLQCVYGEMVVSAYNKCYSQQQQQPQPVTSDATYLCMLPVAAFFVINLVVFLAF